MDALKSSTVTLVPQPDWHDRVALLLVGFAIACSGIATVLYSAGFVVQALFHHV